MREINPDFVTAATALMPVLMLFDKIAGRAMSGVWLRKELGSVVEIVMDFDGIHLSAIAEEDYDTLRIEIHMERPVLGLIDAKDASPWSSFQGQPFGWGWLTINKQGYVDGALLGFGDDIYPKIALTVAASEIKAGAIKF